MPLKEHDFRDDFGALGQGALTGGRPTSEFPGRGIGRAITTEEFESGYAALVGTTVKHLHDDGGVAEPCSCDWDQCRCWALGYQRRSKAAVTPAETRCPNGAFKRVTFLTAHQASSRDATGSHLGEPEISLDGRPGSSPIEEAPDSVESWSKR